MGTVGYKITPAEVRKRPIHPGLPQQSTFHSVLQIPPMDELLSCHPDFSNNELLHSSTELLQMLSGLHYRPIFYSDRLLSESLSDFLSSRSTILRASSGLRQCQSFSNSRTSTVVRLRASSCDGRPPSEFHPSSCENRTPSELLQRMGSSSQIFTPNSYRKQTPSELLR